MSRRAALVAGVALVVAACSAPAGPSAPSELDGKRVMAHVAELARTPRVGDTDAARAAARTIERELRAAGAKPERVPVGVVEIPEVRVLGVLARPHSIVNTTDPDITARFGPSFGKVLLVMAHYDTVPDSPGAVDNAAAVGVLLELARALAAKPPERPVVLAFTANEEIGLLGAEALAAAIGGDVDLAIALDLVGGSGELSINGASELVGATELAWLADGANRAGVTLRAPLAHRVVSRWWPQAERSDHGAFTRRGVRAVHLYDRGQDGELIDRAYHTAEDTLDRVHADRVDEVGRVLVALARGPAVPAHGGDGFWVPVVRGVVVPRWALLALEGLLLAACAWALARRWPRRSGRDLALGALAYAAAIAATAALERILGVAWLHTPARAVLGELAMIAGLTALTHRGLSALLARRRGGGKPASAPTAPPPSAPALTAATRDRDFEAPAPAVPLDPRDREISVSAAPAEDPALVALRDGGSKRPPPIPMPGVVALDAYTKRPPPNPAVPNAPSPAAPVLVTLEAYKQPPPVPGKRAATDGGPNALVDDAPTTGPASLDLVEDDRRPSMTAEDRGDALAIVDEDRRAGAAEDRGDALAVVDEDRRAAGEEPARRPHVAHGGGVAAAAAGYRNRISGAGAHGAPPPAPAPAPAASSRAGRATIAFVIPALIGGTLLALGAAELAWIFLVPAAAAALLARSPRTLAIPLALAALPPTLVLLFGEAREIAWNGFLPAAVPLAAWLGVLGAGAVALAGAAVKDRARWPAWGARSLLVGCVLAIAVGAAAMVTARQACDAGDFKQFDGSCITPADLHRQLHP